VLIIVLNMIKVLQSRIWWWKDSNSTPESQTLQVSYMSQEIIYRPWLVNTLYAGRCFEIVSLCLHYLF